MEAFELKIGRKNKIFWLCRCMGSAPAQWVAPGKWVAPVLINTGCWCYVGSAPYMGSAPPVWVARYIVHFARGFWRPSWCPNWACDSLLERYWILLSNPSGIFQFGLHFPCQKSNLPKLVKMSRMRLPQGRALLQSTFEGLPQLQLELMISHWKDICVYLSFESSSKSFSQPC